jgi:hypothetical protein
MTKTISLEGISGTGVRVRAVAMWEWNGFQQSINDCNNETGAVCKSLFVRGFV